jgi:Xaa-Pro aminopeptidase
MTVAQGRDAGVPHNAGKDDEIVELGKTIVFDIFPQELGNGYFYDFTRTICFGHALAEVQKIHEIVKQAQDLVIDKLHVGARMSTIEKDLCKFFEKQGHPTYLNHPDTEQGYCHPLGHGLGLNVHERPYFNALDSNTDRIKPGHVFTVEPGLYYPNKGFGVRLEDVIYVDTTGRVANLTNYPRNLVVEL